MRPEMMDIPASFRQTIEETFGVEGKRWLQQLPSLVVTFKKRWGFQTEAVYPLSYNYVVRGRREDGTAAVMKLGVPNLELSSEIITLRHWRGRGAVHLLEGIPDEGAMLLERLRPGNTLRNLENDERKSEIAAGLMKQLWSVSAPAEHPLTMKKWALGLQRLRAQFDGGTGPFPPEIVARAEGYFNEFLDSGDDFVLLHGDLHYENILSATRSPWLAIDPKGVLGDPANEIGPWLLNTTPAGLMGTDLKRQTTRRVDQFVEILGLDRQKVMGLSYARAVLSSWWSYEDGVGRVEEQALELARSLNP